jgi:hypothetical protein
MTTITFAQITEWSKLMPPIGISSKAKLAWRRFAVVELNDVRYAIPAKAALAWMKSAGAESMTFDYNALRGQSGNSRIILRVYTSDIPCETPYDPVAKHANELRYGPILDRCEIADMIKGDSLSSTPEDRKAEAKKKRVESAMTKVKEAKKRFEEATEQANEAQSVLDRTTLEEAVSFARKCLAARRLYRNTLENPTVAPDWLLPTCERDYFDAEAQAWATETVSTQDAYISYVASVTFAQSALDDYKPRLSWPSYVASLASEAGMSLAAYKKANTDKAFKTYGPAFDKLKEVKKRATDALNRFIEKCFGEYCEANNLPKNLSSSWFNAQGADICPYSRARLHLRDWPARREDLESRLNEAQAALEKASK